jgi:hypothetical protein
MMKKVDTFACMATALLAITGVLSADDSGMPAGQNITNRGSYYVNGEIHVKYVWSAGGQTAHHWSPRLQAILVKDG